MEKKTYKPCGVCAREIEYTVDDDGIVTDVRFNGGCAGNGIGISALVNGLHKSEVIKRLKGILCNHRNTSCPNELARALEKE